ncbi:hypothetical protein ACWCQN_33205 [Streptomyces sp. NPDC001984]
MSTAKGPLSRRSASLAAGAAVAGGLGHAAASASRINALRADLA